MAEKEYYLQQNPFYTANNGLPQFIGNPFTNASLQSRNGAPAGSAKSVAPKNPVPYVRVGFGGGNQQGGKPNSGLVQRGLEQNRNGYKYQSLIKSIYGNDGISPPKKKAIEYEGWNTAPIQRPALPQVSGPSFAQSGFQTPGQQQPMSDLQRMQQQQQRMQQLQPPRRF